MPHCVIPRLERLDPSTQEHLQQIQASHSVADQIYYAVHQNPHIGLLFFINY